MFWKKCCMLKNQMRINKRKIGYKKWLFLTAIFYILFFAPFPLNAQIEITEIMYNPGKDINDSKADDGREWIEIYNPGGDINLDGWKLFDDKDGSGHPLSFIIQGDFAIKSQEYLIIADIDIVKDSSTFLTDYPNFSGTVLNSNFGSFNNTVGVLAVDEEDAEILSINWVEYSKEQGAYDNNESLQKINGTWVASLPTPGEANSQDSQSPEEDNPEDSSDDPQDETPPSTTTTMTTIPTPTTTYKTEPQIFASIVSPRDIPIAGADFLFEANASGLQNEPLQNAEYQWTFGDGSKAKGQKVLHNYQYPSDYVVVLEVISGKYSASDRLKIKVIPSEIVISEVSTIIDNNFIELHNPSTYELNLSWWRLRVDSNYFTIPKNTILLPKNRIKFSSITTNLFLNQNSLISLLYPNGSIAFNYVERADIVQNVQKEEVKTPILPSSQTQSASIKNTIQPTSITNQPSEVQPPQVEDLSLLATVSPPQSPESKSNKGFFNIWTVSLVGIIGLAITGVTFATKLDK